MFRSTTTNLITKRTLTLTLPVLAGFYTLTPSTSTHNGTKPTSSLIKNWTRQPSQYLPSFTQFLPSNMIAHAASITWQPHPDLPAPTTINEAVAYNDYPPGYSEALPDYTNSPPIGVRKVVASNFEQYAMNPEKDVFVQFSKQGCPSCQSFQLIVDAMSFAFRDIPTVQFLEMKAGSGNYLPGVLTAEEEVMFPSFKIFPAGQAKGVQMQRSKDFVKMVREYNQKLLSEYNPSDPLPSTLEPALAKSKFDGVGYSVPMVNSGGFVWNTFIDIIHDQAQHKFDKEAVKAQLAMIEPALKREITHANRSQLPGYELIGSLSPCGEHWDGFQDVLLRRGVGATNEEEFHNTMSNLNQCLTTRYDIENPFWKEMMKLSIHMSKTLDVVQQAKKHEGLTPDQAHEFFTQYSRAIQQQEHTSKPELKNLAGIPRGQ